MVTLPSARSAAACAERGVGRAKPMTQTAQIASALKTFMTDSTYACFSGGRETTRGAKWTESAKTEPSTGSSCPQDMPRPAESLARDPEKWEPVFGKDHAQT